MQEPTSKRTHILYLAATAVVLLLALSALFWFRVRNRPIRSTAHEEATVSRKQVDAEMVCPLLGVHEREGEYAGRIYGLSFTKASAVSKAVQFTEDGSALPLCTDGKADCAERKGYYRIEPPHTVLFTPSDGTDPRKNGRAYRLRLAKTATRRRAVVRTRAKAGAFTLHADPDATLRTVRISLENLDDEVAVVPWIMHEDDVDFRTTDSIVRTTLKPGMDKREQAMALWRLLVERAYHWAPAEPGDECHDPIKFFTVYGYGWCDDYAQCYTALSRAAGLETRIWYLSGHVVPEVWYRNEWHLFDPDGQVYFEDQDGKIVGIEDLAQQPALTVAPQANMSMDSTKYRELITTESDNSWNDYAPTNRHELTMVLRPREKAVFACTGSNLLLHAPHFPDEPPPPSLGNGMHIRELNPRSLPKVDNGLLLVEEWPYPVLNAALEVELATDAPVPIHARISKSGFKWFNTTSDEDGRVITWEFRHWFEKTHTAACYRFLLLIQPPAGDAEELIKSVRLTTTFQFAPASLPLLRHGANRLHLLTSFPYERSQPPWKGIEAVIEWDEFAP